MSNWGFVEWWTACLIAMNVWAAFAMSGKKKSRTEYSTDEIIASFAVFIPPIGRAMGWF